MATTSFTGQSGTIDHGEVAGFAAIAHEWWDSQGKFAPLHRINPTRLGYIRAQAVRHFSRDGETATPLENLSLLDVGCGGGLICEPMARLGAAVTGIDAAAEAIAVAQAHAQMSQLPIDYHVATPEDLAGLLPSPIGGGSGWGREVAMPHPDNAPLPASRLRGEEAPSFDLVLALEIVEHVADPALFYDALAALVKPGGLLILSTLNRTAKSYAMGIIGAEYILRWVPRGTHDWKLFVKPSEMAQALVTRGFSIADTCGLTFDPRRWSFTLNPRDLDVNYLLTAAKNR